MDETERSTMASRKRPVRALALVAVALVGLAVVQPRLASAAVPPTVFAPYVDMGGPNLGPSGQLDDALAGPLGDFTAGFVLGKEGAGQGCKPVWDDWQSTSAVGDNAINDRIDNATHGGKPVVPIVSFGGASGRDLAITCTSTTNLVAAYQSVIDRFGTKRVDFDVEGAALGNATANTRRFAAIKSLLSKDYNAGLQVSYTLPSDYYGLASDGIDFLAKSKTAGVRPALVNIMAMEFSDYTSAGFPSLGAAAVNAAQQTLGQVRGVWTSGMTYANIGVTPMAGQNINGQVFTLADAATLNDFARKDAHLGRVAMWSINRDRPCASSAETLDSCSRVAQDPLDFIEAFSVAPK